MKETRFIGQNKEKWLESEKLLTETNKDPEKLSNLFVQVVDDLSYSRTYYPNRSVRVYLNKIAREYFSIMYSHHKEKRNRFKFFWLDELPQIIIYCKTPLVISLIVFLLAAAIGIFSSVNDPQFANVILGDDYIAMTKENIQNGDPMAVYKKQHQVDMFLGITFNNLMVAFRTYVLGVFLSIGTLVILLYNGIMVGCFQFFFIERGLFVESALSIWLHGTLEISSIILAGGAGLTLGNGLLFPGSYSRLQAFQLSAMRSLKLMLGITPIFIIAAIIESFLTRYTEVPDVLKLLLIVLSAFFIIGYFVVYPWLKSKRGFDVPLQETKLAANPSVPANFEQIKSNAAIVRDSFLFYKQKFNQLLPWVTILSLLMTAANFYLSEEQVSGRYYLEWWQYLFSDVFHAMKTPDVVHAAINTLGSSMIVYKVFILLDGDFKKEKRPLFSWLMLGQVVLLIAGIYLALDALDGFGSLLVIVIFLPVLILIFSFVTGRSNLLTGLTDGWNGIAGNLSQTFGLAVILLMMSFFFLLTLSSPIAYVYTEIIQWSVAESDVWIHDVATFIETFVKIMGFNLLLPIIAAGAGYLFFSLREVNTASHLKKSIASVGTRLSKANRTDNE
jgi:uncharacterized membrane protein SpoIIM required for sporulation